MRVPWMIEMRVLRTLGHTLVSLMTSISKPILVLCNISKTSLISDLILCYIEGVARQREVSCNTSHLTMRSQTSTGLLDVLGAFHINSL